MYKFNYSNSFGDGLDTLRRMINTSSSVTFFGGAGVSTASGIPDFRSNPQTWEFDEKVYELEDVLSDTFFYADTANFYKIYRDLFIFDVKPNAVHRKLVEIDSPDRPVFVVTQNVDTLHSDAGTPSERLATLHGTLETCHCTGCKTTYKSADYIKKDDGYKIPLCPKCKSILKPDIVLYGEKLDSSCLQSAFKWVSQANLLIVAGSSLSVAPACILIYDYLMAKRYRTNYKAVLINTGDVFPNYPCSEFLKSQFDLILPYDVNEVFKFL